MVSQYMYNDEPLINEMSGPLNGFVSLDNLHNCPLDICFILCITLKEAFVI